MESLPDGTTTSNQRDAFLGWKQKQPGYILTNISSTMLMAFLTQIEERLINECGCDEEEFEDDPLIDEFDRLK